MPAVDSAERPNFKARPNQGRLFPEITFFGERPVIIEKGPDMPSIDFWYGRANPRAFPIAAWRRLIAHNLGRAAANMIDYPPTAGLPELRQAIADHVAANRGIRIDWRNVIITAGAQEAFDIVAKLFVKPGTRVAVENPCYQGLAFTLRAHGATLISHTGQFGRNECRLFGASIRSGPGVRHAFAPISDRRDTDS